MIGTRLYVLAGLWTIFVSVISYVMGVLMGRMYERHDARDHETEGRK